MIIPIKCFTCGTVLADKYAFYCEEVRKRKQVQSGSRIDKVVYLTSFGSASLEFEKDVLS